MRTAAAIVAFLGAAIALGVAGGCGRAPGAPPAASQAYRGSVIVGALSPSGWLESAADFEGRDGRRRVRLQGGDWTAAEGLWPTPDVPSAYTCSRSSGPEICGRSTTRETLTHAPSGTVAAVRDLDRHTGVELRREVYRRDGAVASRTEVTEIAYDVELPAWGGTADEAATDSGVAMSPEEFVRESDFEPVPPSHVPAGYRSAGFRGHQCDRSRWYAEYRYEDGFRTLSVYERRPREGGQGRGAGGQGRGWRGGRGGGVGRDAHGGVGRPQVLDHGAAITVRQRRGDLVVLATGDLTVDEGVAIVDSVPAVP